MRVLVAPQEFKGSLTAVEAADAIARGVRSARPDAELDLLPMSDGGPGFLDALQAAVPSTRHTVPARDALRRSVEASILQSGSTAFVEAAEANGLSRIPPADRQPLHAGTEGVGDLLLAAAALDPERIVVGVGGSATSDGGAGMARTLGARFQGMDGAPLPPGAVPLADLVRIDWELPAAFRDIDVIVATDVRNPLLGPAGAAHVYAPQKGASREDVDILEAALFRYASVLRRSLGTDIAAVPGAGAAGGLAAGLIAFLGARVRSGFDVVAEASRLSERIAAADLVLTGEGSYDAQSSMGKTTHRIQQAAAEQDRPCVVLAGVSSVDESNVFTLASLVDTQEEAIRRAAPLLEGLAARTIRDR